MPFKIIIRDGTGGRKFCVIRLRTGNRPQETKKCHATEKAANKHLDALRIAEARAKGADIPRR